MSACASRVWPAAAAARLSDRKRDSGQISVLILGFTLIAVMLVLAGIDVTAAQLGRVRLMDAADAAALDAADELSERLAYAHGVQETVPISSTSVQEAAATYLARQPRPGGIASWDLAPGTGTPDSHTAVVRLSGTINLPMSALLRSVFGDSITVTVESHARAAID